MPQQGRLGDNAFCPADAHSCTACAHPVTGPAVGGSPDVFVNGRPALRDSDPGVHVACCGSNTWKADGGAPHVFINHLKAFRVSDPTKHCGGDGQLVVGSPDVIVGDLGGSMDPQKTWIGVRGRRANGRPLLGLEYDLALTNGSTVAGLEWNGASLRGQEIPEGSCTVKVRLPEL